MLRVLCFLALVVHGVVSQPCVPDPVSALELTASDTLQWGASTNCIGTGYVVNVLIGDSLQTVYQIQETSIDLSHLRSCVQYIFLVTAVTNNILSRAVFIETPLRALPDPILTVGNITATQQGDDGVRLEWSFVQKFQQCVTSYRVVLWDNSGLPLDTTYTLNTYLVVDGLIPCTEFDFAVTPLFQTQYDGGISLVSYRTPAVNVPFPTLQSVRLGSTYADTIWTLPPYSANPCPIASFILDASPFINLTVPITDSPQRPPVTVRASPLRADSLYMFTVTVINSGGPSPPYPIGLHTLPEEIHHQ